MVTKISGKEMNFQSVSFINFIFLKIMKEMRVITPMNETMAMVMGIKIKNTASMRTVFIRV